MTIRSATRSPSASVSTPVQVGRNRGPPPAASSARPTDPRCGARRHHSAAAVCSTGNGPACAAAAEQAPDGEAGGFGDVEPADEDRPELVGDNSVHIGAVLGQDVGPPVGAVVAATRDREAPGDEVAVPVPQRDPAGPVTGRAQVVDGDRVDRPPHREVHQQVPVRQVRHRPPRGRPTGSSHGPAR